MKLLLDESLPRRLKQEFAGHEVATVPEVGWAGLTNGELLERASNDFEVFVTGDQNLEYQQNLSGYAIRVVVLAARTNRLEDLRPLVPRVLSVLESLRPGTVFRVAS